MGHRKQELMVFSMAMDSLEVLLEYPDAWASVDNPESAVELLQSKLDQVNSYKIWIYFSDIVCIEASYSYDHG